MATINDTRPPLVRFGTALNTALDKAAELEPTFLSASEKTETLVALDTAEQRLHGIKLKLLAAARLGDDACEAEGHKDTADLMAKKTNSDRGKCSAESRLARALDQRYPLTQKALIAGALSDAHAKVIVKVLDNLQDLDEIYADYLTPALLVDAEKHLIDLAARHQPYELKKLAAHLFEVIAPEAAEEIEAKKLAHMDAMAEKAQGITVRRDAHGIEGLSEIRILATDAIADRFTTYLQAFTNPRVTGGFGTDSPDGSSGSTNGGPSIPFEDDRGHKIPQSRRLAMAFAQLLETLDPNRMPIHGGDATNVIVTIPLQALRKDLSAGDHGLGEDTTRMSAAQIRRLACTANLIPAVLGGDSEILDLGRTQRLFNRAQRKAMALRDQQCRADGCTIPATWCEAHHFKQPWSQGGKTNLADGKLLCSFHHHRAHDDRYLHHLMPNGDIRFSRRT